MADDDLDDTDVFEVEDPKREAKADKELPPLFRVYKDSRIAISKSVGPSWKKRLDAALTAYAATFEIWDVVFQYYNNSQDKQVVTPKGVFVRGDGTENVLYSNVNVLLPAIYSKDPNITCSTVDATDEPFCKVLQALLNTLFRRKDILNAKHKIKRAAGFGLLTNHGVLKLGWTLKDDSRELANRELERITQDMAKAKKQEDIDRLYGELAALEESMEVLEPSGANLRNVLPHNCIVDPNAENPDGLDAMWMVERAYLSTAMLNARYTMPDPEDTDEGESKQQARVLVYKPTHKASFTTGEGSRDDGLGVVMQAIEGSGGTGHHSDERAAFIEMYFTECYFVWDKATRRVMLFSKDDWAWPMWVWDDPLKITRFFPYFLIGFAMSTGGTVGVGETAYILDQQDEINDINRQVSKIRRSIFGHFFYNADKIDPTEAAKFVSALSSAGSSQQDRLLGVKMGDEKIENLIMALQPPSANYEALFSKEPVLNAINRITNTNDALRGVQFKSYTNEASVESYQESLRLSVGAKVDVIEDTVSDLANALAELSIQHLDTTDVAGLVGDALAKGWKDDMTVEMFRTQYNVNLVAGSMEKPNSVFKKKEAIQVTQAVGQFAQAAPGGTLMIMLDMLQKAFTDVNIKEEHWNYLQQEIQANLQKGISTGAEGAPAQGAPAQGQQPPQQGQPQGGDQEAMIRAFQQLPPEIQQRVMQMRQQGVPGQEILQFIQQQIQAGGGGQPAPPQPGAQPQGQPH